jgi:hypothetical protein
MRQVATVLQFVLGIYLPGLSRAQFVFRRFWGLVNKAVWVGAENLVEGF